MLHILVIPLLNVFSTPRKNKVFIAFKSHLNRFIALGFYGCDKIRNRPPESLTQVLYSKTSFLEIEIFSPFICSVSGEKKEFISFLYKLKCVLNKTGDLMTSLF